MSPLDELELRVREKFAAAAASRFHVENAAFDVTDWFSDPDTSGAVAVPDDWPQFPREQWVIYPMRRTVVLLLCDRTLDFEELTDEQWIQVCFLMQYGGKERVS